jgi:hypothetical protein
MIAEICVGLGILVLLLLIVYFLFFARPFKYWKKDQKNKTSIIIEAKKNLAKVSVLAGDIQFERKRIRKGQIVEFDFPPSRKPSKLIVEMESGRVETVEV